MKNLAGFMLMLFGITLLIDSTLIMHLRKVNHQNFCKSGEYEVIYNYENMIKSSPQIDFVNFNTVSRDFNKDECKLVGKVNLKTSKNETFTKDVSLEFLNKEGKLIWFSKFIKGNK